MKTKVSIIYVYFNTPAEIIDSVASIPQAINNFSYEVIIIDNNSTIPISSKLLKNKKIKLFRNKNNYGYGKAINMVVKKTSGDFLVMVNPDTIFHKNSIYYMVEKMKQSPEIGMISPKMVDEKGKTLPTISGFPSILGSLFTFTFIDDIFPNNYFSQRYWLRNLPRDKEQYVDVVSGACLVVKKSLFKTIKGFDERFFMYFEEVDLCKRIRSAGYSLLYFPKAKITHLIGKSTSDTKWIQSVYQDSRFKYFSKYHGILKAICVEILLKIMQVPYILLFFVLLLSSWINLYKISHLMMLIGDFGRDYLAARDMILSGKIPLLGIRSSVVWLHQGPLSIYFIGISFLIGKFNPVAPAVLYASFGIITTFLIYKLGNLIFDNKYIGVFSALLYATSPLVVVNERMPYHTSSIPLFACLFFLSLFKVIEGNVKILPLAIFFLGLLFQLELSNGVLFFFLVLVYIFNKPVLSKKIVVSSIGTFLVGILPFILYDLGHYFIQTAGFLLWVLNRVRLFLGLTLDYHSTRGSLPFAVTTIREQIEREIYPASQFIVFIIIFFSFLGHYRFFRRYGYNQKTTVLFLWLVVPLTGFFIHAAPGTAYFPLVFPALSILIASGLWCILKKIQVIPFFIVIAAVNVTFLINNDYFLTTKQYVRVMPPGNYSFGTTWTVQDEMAKYIVEDANKKSFYIKAGGFLKTMTTGLDNYKYLIWWHGGKIDENSTLGYTIYQSPKDIPSDVSIQFSNTYVFIQKQQK